MLNNNRNKNLLLLGGAAGTYIFIYSAVKIVTVVINTFAPFKVHPLNFFQKLLVLFWGNWNNWYLLIFSLFGLVILYWHYSDKKYRADGGLEIASYALMIALIINIVRFIYSLAVSFDSFIKHVWRTGVNTVDIVSITVPLAFNLIFTLLGFAGMILFVLVMLKNFKISVPVILSLCFAGQIGSVILRTFYFIRNLFVYKHIDTDLYGVSAGSMLSSVFSYATSIILTAAVLIVIVVSLRIKGAGDPKHSVM
jgi:hypothetical protein